MQARYLLDANVVSELYRPRPDARVASIVAAEPRLAVSVVLFHELQFGTAIQADPAQRARLAAFVADVRRWFGADALPVTLPVAEAAAHLRAIARRQGRVLTVADALMAATALDAGLTLATRNGRDFDGLGVPLVNPFADAQA